MNAIAPAFGCTAGGIDVAEALQRILALVERTLDAETVALEACAGRVLAQTVTARHDLPPFDQSAMDGYAVRSDSVLPGMLLPVTGRTAAGEAPARLAGGGARRILTGAPLPDGADAVIAQEHVHRDGDLVSIGAVPPHGTNLRRRGEDIRAGTDLIYRGTVLDWRHVAVLASQGVSSVRVVCRPRVALLSSGRELRRGSEDLAPGQIHDSNAPMLAALLTAWGASVLAPRMVADDPRALRAALRAVARDADLVLTTAGISVGDEDHVRDALQALGGDLSVLTVAMKPGKPLAAGRLGPAMFVGLPGNPQAALAGATAFVRPLLARMTGAFAPAPLPVASGFALRRKPGRTEFILARLMQSEAGLRAERTGPDGSGRLLPLLSAAGFIALPAAVDVVAAGDTVAFMPFLPALVTGDR